jgi:hypothetical protein
MDHRYFAAFICICAFACTCSCTTYTHTYTRRCKGTTDLEVTLAAGEHSFLRQRCHKVVDGVAFGHDSADALPREYVPELSVHERSGKKKMEFK